MRNYCPNPHTLHPQHERVGILRLQPRGGCQLYDDEKDAQAAADGGALAKVCTINEVVPATTAISGNK